MITVNTHKKNNLLYVMNVLPSTLFIVSDDQLHIVGIIIHFRLNCTCELHLQTPIDRFY